MELLRQYDEHDVGVDGYPRPWHICPHCQGHGENEIWNGAYDDVETCALCGGSGSIKDLIRAEAGHRCVRCLHPFKVGESGEWEMTPSSDPETFTLIEMFEGLGELKQPVEPRKRGVMWSECSPECRHAGPVRMWSEFGTGPYDPDVTNAEDGGLNGTAGELVEGGFRCQAAWRILTVHHLDGNKANCRWWNLAALCQRCHLEIQGKVHMQQIWPHEHSDWFKPYAAGWYAFSYLGEEIDRPEAEKRMDELLALERVGS